MIRPSCNRPSSGGVMKPLPGAKPVGVSVRTPGPSKPFEPWRSSKMIGVVGIARPEPPEDDLVHLGLGGLTPGTAVLERGLPCFLVRLRGLVVAARRFRDPLRGDARSGVGLFKRKERPPSLESPPTPHGYFIAGGGLHAPLRGPLARLGSAPTNGILRERRSLLRSRSGLGRGVIERLRPPALAPPFVELEGRGSRSVW